ncbi:hypothetical protein jhhlp_005833 [Lomentospora prolificans]|uniref:Uncharacterized protein n=1 Tax=Lomentospora prolificans TaxID=41688 RepID=A0A2N3N474_9PEZI|nr:hypothetical protein jhhlp_005833 [Lomentospora prolificans]
MLDSKMLLTIALSAVPVLIIKGLSWLRHHRLVRFKDWPQMKTSLVWGHMAELAVQMGKGPEAEQFDLTLARIMDSLGNPPLLALDIWPLNYPMAIILNHDIAEQISRASKNYPYSVPKSPTMKYLSPLIGKNSLVSINGEMWKTLRKRYNPGFAPQHLLKLLPNIIEKVNPFLDHLDRFAETGETALLSDYTTNLTFDIIGMATMDMDFAAQRPPAERSEIMTLYLELVDSYKAQEDSPVSPWLLHPLAALRQVQVARRIDPMIKNLIRTKHEELKRGEVSKTRSVLSLALEGVDELTEEVLQQTCDSLKTFLFAGHDTTSILLQWSFYELERSPKVAEALCAELDELFGPDTDPEAVMKALIARGEEIMSKMTYTSAFIKEILRMYPPGGSARLVPPGTGLFVTAPDGKSYCLDGMIIYLCPTIIQRDREVYGPTCNDFLPERWIGDSDTSMKTNSGLIVGDGEKNPATNSTGASKKTPPSAWRPFERGPRNCIGQELANIESKIILACVARRYDFVKVGTGALKRDEAGEKIMGQNGKYVAETELYSSRQITAKPVDGMVAKVRLKPGARPRKP